MKKTVVVLVSLLCAQSALFASASDDKRRERRRRKKNEVTLVRSSSPSVAKFTVGSLYNDMGASHRVEWINPHGACHYVPSGKSVQINEEVPFNTKFDPCSINSAGVSALQRFIKGDHTYLIVHYKEGVWAFRVKDDGSISRKDRKKMASLVIGGDDQKFDFGFVHPEATEKKKTAALISLTLGEHAKLKDSKGSIKKRGSFSSIVSRGRPSRNLTTPKKK